MFEKRVFVPTLQLFLVPACLCVYWSVCVFICLLVPVCVFICLLVRVCVFICLLVRVCVFICLLVSVCVFICLLVSVCVFISLYGFFQGKNRVTTVHQFFTPFFLMSICWYNYHFKVVSFVLQIFLPFLKISFKLRL